MGLEIVVVGGGIGGLAAALALSRADLQVRVLERSAELTEVGAGIQLGPNVTRRLWSWGLGDALDQVVAYPTRVQARDALTGALLGDLALGQRAQQRYGAPYVTVHRADMQQLLLHAVRTGTDCRIDLNRGVSGYVQDAHSVRVQSAEGQDWMAHALVGADGLWSQVRQCLLADGPPRVSGHLAYRAMLRQADLPLSLRSTTVTVWLGPRLHVVRYPVRRGEWLNVVAIVQADIVPREAQNWDHRARADDLRAALTEARAHADLQDVVQAIPDWRLWALCDRAPMAGAHEQAQGRVALLGDAAHPMRPYLAQGAGMAIEDAAELAQQLATARTADVASSLQRYAQQRWQRNAKVQARAISNGQIYHAQGALRWARNAALRVLGAPLMDLPWLYEY